MKNIACRIFKEQIDLINQLPPNERAVVLYNVINDLFNQFDNQNDNQIENQNENAYISVSVLGKSIYNILYKNISCREFSSNYGGKRIGAGAKKKTDIPQIPLGTPYPTNNQQYKPTLDEVLAFAAQQNQLAGVGGFACTPELAEQFWAHYESIGWRVGNESRTPILNWQTKLRYWAAKDKQAPPPRAESEKERKARENHEKIQKMLKGEQI